MSEQPLAFIKAIDKMAGHPFELEARKDERALIVKWLRSLGSETNHFLPATLAGWIEEGMHNV